MTDPSVNMFQYMGAEPAVPLWVKNTEEPRKHAESILRKYGVFESMLPSKAPGIRMCDLFRGCMLMVKPEMMSALDGQLPIDDESALKQQRTAALATSHRRRTLPKAALQGPALGACHRMQSRATRLPDAVALARPCEHTSQSKRLAAVVAAYHGARAEPQAPADRVAAALSARGTAEPVHIDASEVGGEPVAAERHAA